MYVSPQNNLHIHSKLKIVFRNMFKKIKQTSKKCEGIIVRIDYFFFPKDRLFLRLQRNTTRKGKF